MKTFSITVVMPAFNEEANIKFALESILSQKTSTYFLEKIVVICDGCTDGTARVVRENFKNNVLVEIIEHKDRKGKVTRLNEAYKLNNSDILITFDADILLGSDNIVEEIAKKINNDKNALLLAVHQIPKKPNNFFGKVIHAGYELWDLTRLSIKNYDHIQNHYGAASAYRAEFAKTLQIPSTVTDERGFLYLKAKQHNGFRYLKNVHIIYLPVSTLKDFWKQSIRSLSKNQEVLASLFGDRIYEIYKIPTLIKIKAIFKMMIKNPFYTALAILLNILVRMFPGDEGLYKEGMWDITTSTKKAVNAQE
ncbi:glycosyltransferase [Patescibacteria group bacterium]